MTRRDYVKIAKTVVKYKEAFTSFDSDWTGEDSYVDFIHDLCVIFEEDNDRFDSDKFKQATEVIWITLRKHKPLLKNC